MNHSGETPGKKQNLRAYVVAGNRGYTGHWVVALPSNRGSKLVMQFLRARLMSLGTLAVLCCCSFPAAGAGQVPAEDLVQATLIADGSSAQSAPEIAAASSSGLSGPSSVAGQLQSDADSSEGEKPLLPARQRLKDLWQENHGIELGGDYNLLGIYATDSLGEDAAADGVKIDLSPALAVKTSKMLGCSAENWMAMQANHTLARYQAELEQWTPTRQVTAERFVAVKGSKSKAKHKAAAKTATAWLTAHHGFVIWG